MWFIRRHSEETSGNQLIRIESCAEFYIEQANKHMVCMACKYLLIAIRGIIASQNV